MRDYETQDQSVVMIPENYPKAVKEAGGIPLLISECGDSNEEILILEFMVKNYTKKLRISTISKTNGRCL